MMKELNFDEVRAIQVNILDKVDKFCADNDIIYSISAGTLLGAVRHKGFIPWDDDIDIMMPRPDYEKFMSLFNIEGLEIFNHIKYSEYNYPFAKVSDIHTKLIEFDYDYSQYFGVHVDVFPIDGFPVDTNEQIKHMRNIRKYRRTLYRKLRVKRKNIFKQLYINLIISRYTYKQLNEKINEVALRYPFGKTKLSGLSVWGYREKEICLSEIFINTELIEFEGKKYKSISDYDKYLRSIYGNYMELPPENKRFPSHNYIAYKIE